MLLYEYTNGNDSAYEGLFRNMLKSVTQMIQLVNECHTASLDNLTTAPHRTCLCRITIDGRDQLLSQFCKAYNPDLAGVTGTADSVQSDCDVLQQ